MRGLGPVPDDCPVCITQWMFRPGWYEGEIQWHDDDNDTVGILYREDVKKGKAKVYELCLTLAIADGILQIKS